MSSTFVVAEPPAECLQYPIIDGVHTPPKSAFFSRQRYCLTSQKCGVAYFDDIYCYGGVEIEVLSFINTILGLWLLYMHLKVKGIKKLNTYKKAKTWIFILLPISTFITFLRYLITFSNTANFVLLIVCETFQQVLFVLLCYFFTKQTAGMLDGQEKLIKLIQVLFWIFLLSNIAINLYQIFEQKSP